MMPFNLNKLFKLNNFSYDLEDGIKDVKITMIKLRSYNGQFNISCSVSNKSNKNIHEIIQQYFYDPFIDNFTVKEAELFISFYKNVTRENKVLLKLHYLKGCNLQNLTKKEGSICQRYLNNWAV